jgi:hypothetical protein
MNRRILPAVGAFLSLLIIYLVGVIFFYGPIAAEAPPGAPLVPSFVALLVSTILFVALFVWIAREMGNPLKAALAVALSQLLLVDVDYVLTGRRGLVAPTEGQFGIRRSSLPYTQPVMDQATNGRLANRFNSRRGDVRNRTGSSCPDRKSGKSCGSDGVSSRESAVSHEDC